MPGLQSTAADTLSSDSLGWALTHILRFGDTDIFPVPFEFKSVKHCWSLIKPALEELDLTDYRTRGTRRMLVPKPGAGFRVVTQLDPIDAIIYAALSYEAAPGVENSRIPRDRRIACSYRGEDDLLDQDKDRAVKENLVELFEECVAKTPLHLGLARYLLRRAVRLRTPALNETVFKNLTKLRSVFRDVILYLTVSVPKERATQRGNEIVDFLKSSDYGQIPFLRLWGMELFQSRSDMLSPDAALDLAIEFCGDLGTRPSALAARAAKKIDWVRAQKEVWANYSPWDRRAVIYSGSVLPITERRVWLNMIAETSGDILEQAVAKFSKEEA